MQLGRNVHDLSETHEHVWRLLLTLSLMDIGSKRAGGVALVHSPGRYFAMLVNDSRTAEDHSSVWLGQAHS